MFQHCRFVAQQARSRRPRARYLLRRVDLLGVCAILVLTGCTTVGSHSRSKQVAIDYGPAAVMRVCVLKTEDVKEQRPGALLEAVNDEFAPYGITVEVPWVRPWTRAALKAAIVPGADFFPGVSEEGGFLTTQGRGQCRDAVLDCRAAVKKDVETGWQRRRWRDGSSHEG